ncbi:MAG: DUF2088 domain-containing protein [Candidatus Latescibacterota bacterium]|nr:MAG: DUF2088 domain-containing protein [Candidatus Latescibacterota bacterium]
MILVKAYQNLVSNPLDDVVTEVRRQLDHLDLRVSGGEIAITAGSRGISNIDVVTKTVGDWLREHGARPFIVPCMGSHNGATADGQRSMVESLGMTEDAMGMEIRSSMDVVKLGTVTSGDVFMDKHCYGSTGVVVINRVKLHTCFAGPVQSGLMKMMVVGMGKIESARTFHNTPTPRMQDMIMEMGRVILDSGKILAGVAILEDGYDQTAEIHALRPEEIPLREPGLLDRHRAYFPRLPVDDLNVLVVAAIGKTYSGTGMDTNVIGYRGVKGFEDLDRPRINIIAALTLAGESKGNAIGVGLADFITRDLREAIDEEKTFVNVFTTGDMERAKIPATLPNDEELVRRIEERYGGRRWMFIQNTLHLGTVYATQDLREELAAHPLCEVCSEPVELTFENGRHRLEFTGRDRGPRGRHGPQRTRP